MSAARVYLMATAKGRIVTAAQGEHARILASGMDPSVPSLAWWLVEAESVDAARRAIAAWSASGNKDGDWRSSLGARILASGGQR